MTQVIAKLNKHGLYISVDIKNFFDCIPLHKNQRYFTTTKTPTGTYKHAYATYGHKNIAAVAQDITNEIIQELNDIAPAIGFIDDITIKVTNINDTLKILNKLFEEIRKRNLLINPEKCFILACLLDYLGILFAEYGIEMNDALKQKVLKLKKPLGVRQAQSYEGIVKYLSRWIYNLQYWLFYVRQLYKGKGIIKHKRSKAQKRREKLIPIQWTKAADTAYNKINELVKNSKLLHFPTSDDKFMVRSDASNHAIAAVLYQEQLNQKTNKKEFVIIEFYSKSLDKHLLSKYIGFKELLAIVFACYKWVHHLLKRQFLLCTDHKNLLRLWNNNETTSLLLKKHDIIRLRHALSQFSFAIQHKKGADIILADYLTRDGHKLNVDETINYYSINNNDDTKEHSKFMKDKNEFQNKSNIENMSINYEIKRMNDLMYKIRNGETKLIYQGLDIPKEINNLFLYNNHLSNKICKLGIESNPLVYTAIKECNLAIQPFKPIKKGSCKIIKIINIDGTERNYQSKKYTTLRTTYTKLDYIRSLLVTSNNNNSNSLNNSKILAINTLLNSELKPIQNKTRKSSRLAKKDKVDYSKDNYWEDKYQDLVEVDKEEDLYDDDNKDEFTDIELNNDLINYYQDMLDNSKQISRKILLECQNTDWFTLKIKSWLKNELNDDEILNMKKHYRTLYDYMQNSKVKQDDDGLLYVEDDNIDKCIIPRNYIFRLIKFIHDNVHDNHPGQQKTYDIIKAKYYWCGMNDDIINYVKTCRLCQAAKGHPQHKWGKLLPITATRFGQFVQYDYAGPFFGLLWILVITDRYTGYTIYSCTYQPSAESTIFSYLQEWIPYNGHVETLFSDNGSAFSSELTKKTMPILGTKTIWTPFYVPNRNGFCERLMTELKKYIKTVNLKCDGIFTNAKTMAEKRRAAALIELIIPGYQFYKNNKPHAITKLSSNQMTRGYNLRGIDDIEFAIKKLKELETYDKTSLELVFMLQEQLQLNQKLHKERNDEYIYLMCKNYNKNKKIKIFNLNDRVMYYIGARKSASYKLKARFAGPFKITKILGKKTYEITLEKDLNKIMVAPVHFIKKYYGRDDFIKLEKYENMNEEERKAFIGDELDLDLPEHDNDDFVELDNNDNVINEFNFESELEESKVES